MRLISCHIENFGKLSNVDLDFCDGCFVLCQANGWGKSTLAAFLRIMLFGFEGESRRSEAENERRRFAPWQGGAYGGSLTFAVGEKTYTVSRIFGDKEKNDSFELRDAATNLPSGDFSARLGEELFSINSASFARTVFVGQNDCVTKTTDSINAKVSSLSGISHDLDAYEAANEKLQSALNALTPRRKTGKLSRLAEEITVLQTQLLRGEGLEEAIKGCESLAAEEAARQEALKEKRREIFEEQRRVSRQLEALSAPQETKKERSGQKMLMFAGCLLLLAGVVSAVVAFLGGKVLWNSQLLLAACCLSVGSLFLICSQQKKEEPPKETAPLPSLTALQEAQVAVEKQLEEGAARLDMTNRKLTSLREEADALQECRERLAAKKEEQKALRLSFKRIQLAQSHLSAAKEAMTARYMAPLQSAFSQYYTFISAESAANVRLDANINLSVVAHGLQRNPALFSCGYQDLMGLCLRLALVVAMYPMEKPFLILDDPFVHLDKEKEAGAWRLLHELEKEYQILYFTAKTPG